MSFRIDPDRPALDHPTDAALHEWRKRAKYGWHHAKLLHAVAPSALGPLEKRLRDLSDGLGDDHDLAVLRTTIGRERPVGEIGDLAREPADRPPVARELLVDGAVR